MSGKHHCRVCSHEEGNVPFEAREMMLGSRETFTYFECVACGCVQIRHIPPDLSRYYPPEYYSFSGDPAISPGGVARRMKILRNTYAVFNDGLLGRLIYMRHPDVALRSLSALEPDRDSPILDVGCGAGSLLYALRECGFKNLLGIDPYLTGSIRYRNGLEIRKSGLDDLENGWRIIMFHHSFEHLPDPKGVLKDVARLLDPDGVCLIRMPTVSSYAWKTYRENWVQLDAPRHLHLHSLESMKNTSRSAGFGVDQVVYDSTEFQFWGSEQYTRDIALISDRSYAVNPRASIFSASRIRSFKRRAAELNSRHQGDSAVFYLRKG